MQPHFFARNITYRSSQLKEYNLQPLVPEEDLSHVVAISGLTVWTNFGDVPDCAAKRVEDFLVLHSNQESIPCNFFCQYVPCCTLCPAFVEFYEVFSGLLYINTMKFSVKSWQHLLQDEFLAYLCFRTHVGHYYTPCYEGQSTASQKTTDFNILFVTHRKRYLYLALS
jgi:hypothetical protein